MPNPTLQQIKTMLIFSSMSINWNVSFHFKYTVIPINPKSLFYLKPYNVVIFLFSIIPNVRSSEKVCLPKPCNDEGDCYPSERCIEQRTIRNNHKVCIPDHCKDDKGTVVNLYCLNYCHLTLLKQHQSPEVP